MHLVWRVLRSEVISAGSELLEIIVCEILCYFSQTGWPCIVPVVVFCSRSGLQKEML